MLELVLALALGQTPTPPDPTPTPIVTPTPDPGRPARVREDNERSLFVSAAHAPDDYYRDRDRGTVRYDPEIQNYSFQRVVLPPARPLVITDTNFTQERERTIVFWRVAASGTDLAVAVRTDRALPDGHTVAATEAGCRLRLRGPGGWTRGIYTVTGLVGTRWQLDRNASATQSIGGGIWQLLCPVRDFSEVTFSGCNLRNVWLPTLRDPPTLIQCQRHQADLPPEPTP